MSDLEERELDAEEAAERFDDETDRLEDEAESESNKIPVRCIVNGHEFEMYPGLHYCRHCGQEQP